MDLHCVKIDIWTSRVCRSATQFGLRTGWVTLALVCVAALPPAWAVQQRGSAGQTNLQPESRTSAAVPRLSFSDQAEFEDALGTLLHVATRDAQRNLSTSATRWLTVQDRQYKSRREIIEEVERTYRAKVLKVDLDRDAGVYEVRILQADGRVRTIRIAASK